MANQKDCEALFVLGDLVSPFAMTALNSFRGRVFGVYGNNDGDRLRLQQAANSIGADFSADPRSLSLNGHRFLMMHEPFLIDEAAESGRYDYVMFGHLHEVVQRRVGQCQILNPGELGGWLGKSTMMLIDLEAQRAEVLTLERGQHTP